MIPPDVRWTVSFLFFVFSSINGICLNARPTRLLLCYQDASTPELNPCLCTHLVQSFYDIKNITKPSELLRDGQKHKEKNPDLQIIASISGSADTLIKDRNFTARKLATALEDSQMDGFELNIDWENSLVQKQALADFFKKLTEEFEGRSLNRVKRHYDVREQQTDDFTTIAWTTQKNSSKSQPRVVRESSENEEETVEEESTSEVSEGEDEGEVEENDRKFTVFLRLPNRPQTLAKHYDVKQLNKYVDFFVLSTHNITDPAETNRTYHPSRLIGINDVLNADSLVDLLTGLGAPNKKLVISVPSKALKFTLEDEKKNLPQSPIVEAPSSLTQLQLCQLMSNGKWMIERDEDLTAPYAFNNKTWIAFDDATSASIKGKYILLRELAGVAVMNVEAEDWANKCAEPGPTVLSTLYDIMSNIARKTRAAQLYSLQNQLHQASPSPFAAHAEASPYRVVRVVDRAGDIHVVRRQIKTEFECSRQGYFTHPTGCNRFYRCVKFNQYVEDYTVFEYDCPAGLAFDERYEVCVWPGSLPDGGACQGSSEIAPVPRNRYVCPAVEGYYADPENCRWFFACLDHARDGVTPLTAYEFRCPFGLVFNEALLVCDWPWNVKGCGQSGYAGARLTVGDLYEGRLRPSYATLPDYYVSGGRIEGINGGLVLGSNLAGIPGVLQYEGASSNVGGNFVSGYANGKGLHGVQYEEGSSNLYNGGSKNYVQYSSAGSTATSGAQYAADAGSQYSTGGGQQYTPGSGGQYVDGSSGKYTVGGNQEQYLAGGSGGQYSTGDNGIQYTASASGSQYTTGGLQYSPGTGSLQLGGLVSQYASSSGKGYYNGGNIQDNSGAYIHDNSGAYIHDNSGDYVHKDAGYQKGIYGKGNGDQYAGQYAETFDNSGAYIHNAGNQNVGINSGKYSSNKENYDGGDEKYVKVSGVSGHYTGSDSNVYINTQLGSGQSGKVYQSGQTSTYNSYAGSHGVGGEYIHDNSGAYVHDNSGDYAPDNSGTYAGHNIDNGEKYSHDSGKYSYSEQAISTANGYASGISSGGFNKGVSVNKNTYNIHSLPVVTVTTSAPIAYSSLYPGAVSVSGHDAYHSVQPIVSSTPAPAIVHYNALPVSTPAPAVSTPGPIVSYYSTPSVSTPAPVVSYHSIPSVSSPAPIVSYHSAPSISTPAPILSYHKAPSPPVSYYKAPLAPISSYHSAASVSTTAPIVYQNVPSVTTPASPILNYDLPVVTTPSPVISYHNKPVSGSTPLTYSINSGNSYYPTPTPAPAYKPYPQSVTTTYIASTPKPVSYYQSPSTTPAPVYKKVSVAAVPPVAAYVSHDTSTYNFVTTPRPVVFKSPAPVNYSPYPTGITSVTTLPYVSRVTPCDIKAHSQYAGHVHLPEVSITPTVDYSKSSYNYDYSYQKPVPKVSPVIPLAPVSVSSYHHPVVPVTPAPAPAPVPYQYSYKRPVTPVVPVTPAPEILHYQSITPAPVPVQYSYKKPIVPVTPVTPAPEIVHYESVTPVPTPIQYSYKKPVEPVTFAPEVVHYQSITPAPVPVQYSYKKPVLPVAPVTPAPDVVQYQPVTPAPVPVQYSYKKPIVPVVPVTPAPEVVHYQPIAPAPAPIQYSYKRPFVPVAPVTPAPQSFHYQSVTPAPVPIQYSYKKPVTPIIPVTPAPEVIQYPSTPIQYSYKKPVVPVVPVTPAPEIIKYQSVTPAPVPIQYSYKRPAVPVTPVTPAPAVVHYQPINPAPVPIQYSYQKPVVPITTESPVSYTVSTPAPVVYHQPVQPVVPVKLYSTAKKPTYIYSTPAPVTPVKQIFYNEPVTTLAPIYKKPAVISSFDYKVPENAYYNYEATYTTKPEIQQYYQKPAVFSYSYESKPVKPLVPVDSYQTQQGIYAPAAPLYGYKESVDAYKFKPIIVAPYTPAPSLFDVTTPKCQTPVLKVTTPTPIPSYSATSPTPVPSTSSSVETNRYDDKIDVRFGFNYANKDKSETYNKADKLPEQYLVEVTPQTITQYETDSHIKNGYSATANAGNNVYLQSEVRPSNYKTYAQTGNNLYYSTSENEQQGIYENFESVSQQPGYTTQTSTIKPIHYTYQKTSTAAESYPSTESYVPKQSYSAENEEKDELDIAEEGNDDQQLISQYSGQFGSKSTEYTTVSSSTANLQEGEAIVGVVKTGHSKYTGERKQKVVVVSRLSDFNPLLVNKLGAQCDCNRVVRKRRPRPKLTTQGLFEPSQTTVIYEPSYASVDTAFDSASDVSETPTVEIKPVRRRKTHRSTTTEAYLNEVENESEHKDNKNTYYKHRVNDLRKKPTYQAQGENKPYENNNPINVKESEDVMNGNVECKRAGLFRHPKYCNKFYSCNWDQWKKKFTLSVMNCPIHLAYDDQIGACNWPSKGPACSDNNLLV